MNRINYKIEDFEGPLDLLLVLISRNKMSIADVEIITIINQYLAVINAADRQDLDTASEFIDMAARLIYLKSVYLLPKDDEGEKLKAELAARGWFAPERKKRLPLLPRKVGVVTSETGAVIHDIQNVAFRRYPNYSIVLAPAAVQGTEAAGQIVRGIELLDAMDDVDVIIDVVDASTLERNLYLTLQLLELGKPVVMALMRWLLMRMLRRKICRGCRLSLRR